MRRGYRRMVIGGLVAGCLAIGAGVEVRAGAPLTVHASPDAAGATAGRARIASKPGWTGRYVTIHGGTQESSLTPLWTPWPRWWVDWTEDDDRSDPRARFLTHYRGQSVVVLRGPQKKKHVRCAFRMGAATSEGTHGHGVCQVRASGKEVRAAIVVAPTP